MFFTTHGKHNLSKLLPDERKRFLSGRPVFRTRAAKGKKWYVAYHPASYVRENLPAELEPVFHEERTTVFGLKQEIWIVQKRGS